MKLLASLAGLLFVLWLSLWLWNLERRLHYRLGYRSMVIDTVRTQVRPECLLP